MTELAAEFDSRENQLMSAWMKRDGPQLRTLISRDCLMLIATAPPVLLDRPSFIAATDRGVSCEAFRFHETTARRYAKNVWFSGHVELELRVCGTRWSGHFLITDLWRKSGLRRRWRLMERSLAPAKEDRALSDAFRALQLWR